MYCARLRQSAGMTQSMTSLPLHVLCHHHHHQRLLLLKKTKKTKTSSISEDHGCLAVYRYRHCTGTCRSTTVQCTVMYCTCTSLQYWYTLSWYSPGTQLQCSLHSSWREIPAGNKAGQSDIQSPKVMWFLYISFMLSIVCGSTGAQHCDTAYMHT